MAYDKKSSTIKFTTDDPKDFERDLLSHFAHVIEQVDRDLENGSLHTSKKAPVKRNEPRAALRDALLESYQPRDMFGRECFFCGRTGALFCPNLLEYYHDAKYKKAVGLVPTSEARGRVRGYLPICIDCANRCGKCGLPIRTKWVERMTEQVRTRGPHLTVSFGQGFCRHMHPIANLQSYFKSLFRIGGRALSPEEYEGANSAPQRPSAELPIESFIYAMGALGSPNDPQHLRTIGEDAIARYLDPYIAALEATKIIVDGVVLQSSGEHGLLAHLMRNNCMGVVSLFLQGEVKESTARQYFQHFNDLPRRALGLRPEATARLPTFEQTITMVQENHARKSAAGDT